jgi:hypothetical protein
VGGFGKTVAAKPCCEKIAVKAITCTGCINGVNGMTGDRLQARRCIAWPFDQHSALCSTS